MKRYISLACVALIVVMCMVSPVSATEANSGSLINVLDYATANYSGQNIVYSSSNSLVANATYSIPFSPYYRYVDLIVNTISGPLVSCSINGSDLIVEEIQPRLYRVYGIVSTSSQDLYLTFTGNVYNTGFNVLAFNISTYSTLAYDIEGYCDIGTVDYVATIHYVPTDEINYRQFLGTEVYDDSYLSLFIYTEDWKKYDFIDFQLNLSIGGINSISAAMGSTIVPLEICQTNDSSFVTNDYYLTIRMDLRGLDRTSDDFPFIQIDGLVAQGLVNTVHVVNVSGHVNIDNLDANNYWLYRNYLNILNGFARIYDYFNSLNIWLSTQTESITSSISSGFTSLKDSIYVHFTNLNSWISAQTELIKAEFVSLTNNISAWIYNLSITIKSEFVGLKDSIFVHFTNLNTWIEDQTASLESAIRGDTAPGDSFQDEVDQKDQQLNNMAAVMDSVAQPDLNSVNVSADTYVDSTVLAASMSGVTAVIGGPVFLDIIMMSLMMATAGYVLFGKR